MEICDEAFADGANLDAGELNDIKDRLNVSRRRMLVCIVCVAFILVLCLILL